MTVTLDQRDHSPRHRKGKITLQMLAGCASLCLLLLFAGAARAAPLVPPSGQTFFGVSDTGNPADFNDFSSAVGLHPAVIETFTAWGRSLRGAVERWAAAQARPILHISTADSGDGHEIITPQGIANGGGDDYLLRLNNDLAANGIRAYVRPLGEPNRCLNVYAAFDCAGKPRGPGHKTHWYKQAFRRMYILLHGGGSLAQINAWLAGAHLPPLNLKEATEPSGLPAAPVAVIWSPLPGGSPAVKGNRPLRFYPGRRFVDWVGTDIYSGYPVWKALNRFYHQFRGRPFALPEWGVSAGDDPRFVRRIFAWIRRHRRCRMLVYYQDFGSTNLYRIQNYPSSGGTLARLLRNPTFPPYPPFPPIAPSGGTSG